MSTSGRARAGGSAPARAGRRREEPGAGPRCPQGVPYFTESRVPRHPGALRPARRRRRARSPAAPCPQQSASGRGRRRGLGPWSGRAGPAGLSGRARTPPHFRRRSCSQNKNSKNACYFILELSSIISPGLRRHSIAVVSAETWKLHPAGRLHAPSGRGSLRTRPPGGGGRRAAPRTTRGPRVSVPKEGRRP